MIIPIKICYECRCSKCGDYQVGQEIFILQENDVIPIFCDYCDSELFSIKSKEKK